MMDNLSKKLVCKALVAASVATVALAGVGTANASPSYGYAYIGFTNFTLSGVIGVAGVTVNTTSVTMTDGANYPGFAPGGGSSVGNILTGVDALQATSGPGAFPGQNVFTQQMTAAAGTRGDGNISGALAGGATSDLVAEGRLLPGGTSAGSSAGTATGLNVTFTTTAGTTVLLTFNAGATVKAAVGQTGDSASAQVSATYKIVNTATGAAVSITDTINGGSSTLIAPNALNTQALTNASGFAPSIVNPFIAYSFSASLAPGTYQISLQDDATVILSNKVPEPASLGLLGIGLLGLVVGLRRKAVSVA